MTEILSHKFMLALEEPRDRLYTLARATAATPAKAEAALQQAVRTQFVAFAQDPYMNVASAVLGAFAAPTGLPAETLPMPADVWARLSAAVQIEASRSNKASALNPDSVLLSPDPLLAPKTNAVVDDGEAFDLSPSSRFVLASVIAVIIGIVLTIYILSRPAPVKSPVASEPSPAISSGPAAQPVSP